MYTRALKESVHFSGSLARQAKVSVSGLHSVTFWAMAEFLSVRVTHNVSQHQFLITHCPAVAVVQEWNVHVRRSTVSLFEWCEVNPWKGDLAPKTVEKREEINKSKIS